MLRIAAVISSGLLHTVKSFAGGLPANNKTRHAGREARERRRCFGLWRMDLNRLNSFSVIVALRGYVGNRRIDIYISATRRPSHRDFGGSNGALSMAKHRLVSSRLVVMRCSILSTFCCQLCFPRAPPGVC